MSFLAVRHWLPPFLHNEYPKMVTTLVPDYVALDVPEVLLRLFHPRPESALFNPPTFAQELLIPVDPGVAIGARFYAAGTEAPTLLFFHGNGEIVADYEDLGPLYTRQGLNFFPVDYRGYGRSTGTPTVTAMMRDCQVILAFAQEWLAIRAFQAPWWLWAALWGAPPPWSWLSGIKIGLTG
jgi:hypothetical protein